MTWRVIMALFWLGLSGIALPSENVRLGFSAVAIRDLTRAEVRSTMDLWAQELGARFQVPVRTNFYEDREQMNNDFRLGKINGVTDEAMFLARNFRLDELAEGYATIQPGGFSLLLLSSKTGSINSLGDLAKKRVALPMGDEAARVYLETICLRQLGRDCVDTFSDIQFVANNNQAIMRLFFGKADLALVNRYGYDLATEMNPQLAQTTNVIAERYFKSQFFAFYSPKVSKEFRTATLSHIPGIHRYPRGRQLLDMFKIDHLELAEPSDLIPFVELDHEYKMLKARQARAGGKR